MDRWISFPIQGERGCVLGSIRFRFRRAEVIKVHISPIVGLKSGCIFLGEDYVSVVLGMEGIFGIQKDRPQKGDEPGRKGTEETNIAQKKEEKGRREHKGKERGKGAATRIDIAK